MRFVSARRFLYKNWRYLISGLERLYSNCPLAEYAGFPGDFAFGHHLIGSDMPMSLAV